MKGFESLPDRLRKHAQERPSASAIRWKEDGNWTGHTWGEVAESVTQLAAALIRRGIQPQDRVLIWSENSARWMLMDLAIMTAGAATVPVYSSSTPAQAEYIMQQSGAKAAFLSSSKSLKAVETWTIDSAKLQTIVLMADAAPSEEISGVPVLSWEAFASDVDAAQRDEVEARREALAPDQLATIIYTSGTSGTPKGVMLNHRAVVAASDAILQRYQAPPDEIMLSYLPMAHAVERLISIFLAVSIGCSVWIAESIDRMPDNLKEVEPTIFAGVPRVWEKFAEGIQQKVASASGFKQSIFNFALNIGTQVAKLQDEGKRPGFIQGMLYNFAEKKVYQPLKAALGLSSARYLVSGGAPLRRDTMDFLSALGLPVLEVYGQTETLVTTINTPHQFRFGSVGQVVTGMNLRFGPEGDMEVSGDFVFGGYWQNEEATAESFTEDGWFQTGDIGKLDSDGFLYITGRRKALIITAVGKNVAPEPIEEGLQAIPGVDQAVMIGDQRKFCSALLTLNEEEAQSVAGKTADAESLAKDETVLAQIQAGVDEVNGPRASFEQIKRFHLLPQPFTMENEELTPTLKIRRNVVERRYAAEIEALYEE